MRQRVHLSEVKRLDRERGVVRIITKRVPVNQELQQGTLYAARTPETGCFLYLCSEGHEHMVNVEEATKLGFFEAELSKAEKANLAKLAEKLGE